MLDLSNPYEAPKAAGATPRAKPDHMASAKLFGAALAAFALTIGLMAAINSTSLGMPSAH